MTPAQIAAAVERIIVSVVHDYALDTDTNILPTNKLRYFGMDEADVIEIVYRIEQSFKIQIPDDAITDQSRIGDIVALVADLLLVRICRDGAGGAACA